jgi:hypothetical protein
MEKHKQAIDRLYEMQEEDNIDKISFIERKKYAMSKFKF